MLATGFAFLAGIGQAVFFANLLWSLRAGPEIESPWDDLLGGQNMPSPEWDGFPYRPPTPTAVQDAAADGGVPDDETDGPVAADGGDPDAIGRRSNGGDD